MRAGVDARVFPATSAYLSKLPDGFASYPEAMTKGILMRSAISSHPFHPSWKGLPPEIVSQVKSPPLPTSWASAVLTDTVFCLIADTFYPSREAVLKWSYDRTYHLARVPLFSAITDFAGLEHFLRGAARLHNLFQRGTVLDVASHKTGADMRLRHPPHLHGELNHVCNEGVFRAALDTAGAGQPKVEMLTSTPEGATYRASWVAKR